MFLKPARQAEKRFGPRAWEDFEHGDWWYSALAAWLKQQDPIVFGELMVTLGGVEVPWPDSRIKCHYSVAPWAGLHVQADWHALPFLEESVDWVELPFVLEYVSDPHRVLREADRMLRADGHLLVVSNNPIGLHNSARIMPKLRQRVPWSSRLFSSARIKDWLALLNYEVIHQGYFGPGCPWPSGQEMPLTERLLYQKLPMLSAGYVLIARKREWPLTWSRSQLRSAQRIREGNIVPVGRQASS
ncbi:MAG: Methyltransferase domain [Idiomarinaceae bacterium HL-53]|nr:MAG: Methyltransferase domain [Idiomarinaceae bacterium HL-53]CUS48680.1 Methyltransferase domain-containing protein [Idiomarinaceae bacterium HL-53]